MEVSRRASRFSFGRGYKGSGSGVFGCRVGVGYTDSRSGGGGSRSSDGSGGFAQTPVGGNHSSGSGGDSGGFGPNSAGSGGGNDRGSSGVTGGRVAPGTITAAAVAAEATVDRQCEDTMKEAAGVTNEAVLVLEEPVVSNSRFSRKSVERSTLVGCSGRGGQRPRWRWRLDPLQRWRHRHQQ